MNITSQEYQKILDTAPADHNSNEFLLFLRENNNVLMETPEWLVIENVKYHTLEKPWYTAFYQGSDWVDSLKLQMLQHDFPEYRYLIHSVFGQTVKRFHIHLLRMDIEYTLPSICK